MHGLLNINKPAGMTSRRAVDIVDRLTRPDKSGHAGTLDPLATGVLVVCVGAATRWIEYVQQMPKHYVGTFLLGRQSATEDTEGEVVKLPDQPRPTRNEIVETAGRFLGTIAQRPPAFSAVKIAGRRAYELARKGQSPQLTPRPVEIHRIEVLAYQYPELVLDIACGSGTYIRSLGRDLAESLGTAAVMSALTRTSIGHFALESAVNPYDLTADNWRQFLRPTSLAVEHLPRVRLSADEVNAIRCGRTVPGKQGEADAGAPEIAAFDPAGELIGIVAFDAAGCLRTLRNMPTA
jgi:tRNA pseudouridine55 synthase